MTTRYALRVRYISLKLIILRLAIILGLRLWAIETRNMARHLDMILPQDRIMSFQWTSLLRTAMPY